MILSPTVGSLTNHLVPPEPVRRAAYFFAYGTNPAYLDAARVFANLSASLGFEHIVIVSDQHCTRANYLGVIAAVAEICKSGGLCWLGIATHGSLDDDALGSTIQMAESSVSSREVADAITSLNHDVRLLLTIDACQTQLFLSQNHMPVWTESVTGTRPQVIAIGVDGFSRNTCGSVSRSCFALELSAAATHATDYRDLLGKMNTQRTPGSWSYAQNSSVNAGAFQGRRPLT